MVFDSSTDSYMPKLSRALNPEMVCLEAHQTNIYIYILFYFFCALARLTEPKMLDLIAR